MTDPLQGQRKAVNERKATMLRWPATKVVRDQTIHLPCPLEKGDRFELQSCAIEIDTVTRKLIKGRPAEWQATFIRHEQDTVNLLRFTPPTRAPRAEDSSIGLTDTEKARREGSYTSTAHAASPHEPESVGPDWEDKHAAERELARQTQRRERMTTEQQDREVDKAAARLKQVYKTMGRNGTDLTYVLEDLYKRMANDEREAT